MAKRVTSKDVVEVLTKIIEENSPNGDLDRLYEKMSEMQASQTKVVTNLHKLEKRLYNPDDGVVVQLNNNTRVTRETRDCVKKRADDIDGLNHDVKVLKGWKTGVTKMLWVMMPAALTAIGYAAKMALFK